MRSFPWVWWPMADSDIPDRFGPAVRWVLAGIALFVFFLLGSEALENGHYRTGTVFFILFALTLAVTVKWDQIVRYLGRDKVTPILIVIAVALALGLGVVLTLLFTRRPDLASSGAATGRITWNFNDMDAGRAYFLAMGKLNQDEIRVFGFNARGRNTSKDPISEFSGYVRSDLTNARLPIYIMAENPNAPAQPNFLLDPVHIPTRPEETFGIPGLAEFDIVTHESAILQQGIDGMPVSQFLREFGSFTLILEYDGIKVARQFSNEKIRGAIAKFESEANPAARTTSPRVTRRPNATPPVPALLPFQSFLGQTKPNDSA